MRVALPTLLLLLASPNLLPARDYADLKAAPHFYWDTKPQDPFTQLMDEVLAGKKKLQHGNDLISLRSLLEALHIPVSSQMLVFSATSLQSGKINPDNPRALYFNEDTYVGYVPGGRLEIISMDPKLGAIFYILDVPRGGAFPIADRSTRCMNCHSGDRMNFVPGIAIESVIPSSTGASLDGFRRGIFGHGVPLADRFGGWVVTGAGHLTKHHGNLMGELSPQGLELSPIIPGKSFTWDRYPVSTSDALAQLLHEHQAGFANLLVEGIYKTRYAQHLSPQRLTPTQEKEIDDHAEQIVRYILFADEVALPNGGIAPDAAYQADFRRNRKALPNGASLKDLDLKTRLFRYRCSYMVYSSLWSGMPGPLKNRVHARLQAALSEKQPAPDYAYLPPNEKRAIRIILKHTLPGLPSSWEGS